MNDIELFFKKYPEHSDEAMKALSHLACESLSDPSRLSSIRERATQWGHGDLFYLLWKTYQYGKCDKIMVELSNGNFRFFDGVDLNKIESSGYYKGQSIAWAIANCDSELELNWLTRPEFLKKINLNFAPKSGEDAGKSVAWVMAETKAGRDIFTCNPDALRTVDLNQAPKSGDDAGKSIAWLLAEHPPTPWARLEKEDRRNIFITFPDAIRTVNLNQAPEFGDDAGKSIAWLLAKHTDGRKILHENPNLLSATNLNQAPLNGREAGISVACLLAGSSLGRQTFKKYPTLLQGIDLDMAAEYGETQGKTVGNYLIQSDVARPIFEAQPSVFIDSKLYLQCFKNPQGNLKSVLEVLYQLGAIGLVKYALLFHADPHIAITPEGRVVLTDIQRSLKASLNKIFSLFYIDLAKEFQCDTLKESLCFKALIVEHPELHFIEPVFHKFIEHHLKIMLSQPYDRLACLILREHYLCTGVYPANDVTHTLQQELIKESIARVNNEQSWPAEPNQALRQSLMGAVSRCERLSREAVESALRAGYEHWRTISQDSQTSGFFKPPSSKDNKRPERSNDDDDVSTPAAKLLKISKDGS